MHKVEIRLTNEGSDEPAANFEVYIETLKDGKYIELAPMRLIAGGGSPITMFLEDAERVIVVAKTNVGRLVYDKEQNANVRVPTDEEVTRNKARDENLAKSATQQGVRSAQAEAKTVKELGQKAQNEADANVRKAQAEANKATPASSSAPSSHPNQNPNAPVKPFVPPSSNK